MDENLLIKFTKIFKGLDRGYGTYKITSKDKETGKAKGVAKTISDQVTSDLYRLHLEGKQGLGIIPINDSDTCVFGAIDIDEYKNFSLNKLEDKINKLKLPLVITRTKSGGAHLWIFLKEETEASIVKNKLMEFSKILGYPGCEIFPKQQKLAGKRDIGNWINLPYFNITNTNRYAVKGHKRLSFSQFLSYTEKNKISRDDLLNIKISIDDEIKDAPICLQRLCSEGVTLGKKNNSLFNIGVFCKLKYGSDWKEKLENFNQKFVIPPAEKETLKKVMMPLNKKDYFYTCQISPLINFCDKKECKKLKFGIGGSTSLNLGQLTIIETEPPTWILEVEDKRIEILTEDMLSQEKFRKVCIEKLLLLPHKIRSEDWDELIRTKLDEVEIIEAPPDASPKGQFLRLFEDFCNTRALAKSKDEILMGKPWINKNFIYFRSSDLLEFLERKKFRDFKPKKVWSTIKDIGGIHKQLRIKGRNLRVWGAPIPEFQNDDFNTPEIEKGDF